MFRGINSVVKHFPWYDEKLLDPVRQQQLQDWGFNAVRLGNLQLLYLYHMLVCLYVMLINSSKEAIVQDWGFNAVRLGNLQEAFTSACKK